MGFFDNFFKGDQLSHYQQELAERLNKIMLVTFEWEQKGESFKSNDLIELGNVIRNNFEPSLDLYIKCKKLGAHRNFTFKNRSLPIPPYPLDFIVFNTLHTTLNIASEIASRNSNFPELIHPSSIQKFMKQVY
ncbi:MULTISPECIES: hypothetical protein [Sphingobacterium]|uniref:hypothetical protein n=1 Tax=Sphingobacterium TaxID=28453 RepID=UPI001629F357|nr:MULTISPECIES: hypothetical protein [Sphingobacterium]